MIKVTLKDGVVKEYESGTTVAEVAEVDLIQELSSSSEKAGYARMDNSALNSEKLRSLGWRGCFTLERGVRRTIELLRSNYSYK